MAGFKEYVEEKLDFLQIISRYKSLFLTPRGKKVLLDLAKFCKYDDTVFDKDALSMARNEGRRQVFLYILNQINYDVEALMSEDFDQKEE